LTPYLIKNTIRLVSYSGAAGWRQCFTAVTPRKPVAEGKALHIGVSNSEVGPDEAVVGCFWMSVLGTQGLTLEEIEREMWVDA
jgi:hypothetical protein